MISVTRTLSATGPTAKVASVNADHSPPSSARAFATTDSVSAADPP